VLPLLLLGCSGETIDAIDSAAPLPICADRPSELAFVDLAPELGLEDAQGRNRGVAAADFDLDGDVDLYLANLGDPARLWLNDGSGRFEESPAPQVAWASAASAVDFDDDGDPDLMVSCGGFSATCANGLFRNEGRVDGELVWTDVSASSGVGAYERASFGSAWADVDGDGDLDLYVSNQDLSEFWVSEDQGGPTPGGGDMSEAWPGPPDLEASSADVLWVNDGDGTFTDLSSSSGLAFTTGHSHQAAFADLDEDGDMDLVVPVFMGPNQLYWNDGAGGFELERSPDFQDPMSAFGVLVRDFDQDGHLDLLFAANYDGHTGGPEDHAVWLFGPEGAREEASEALMERFAGGTYGVMGLQGADFDLDGGVEVFFGNGNPMPGGAEEDRMVSAVPGEGLIWADRSHHVNQEVEGYPFRSHGTGVADFDGDGLVDLFLGSGGVYADQREPNRYFHNDADCRNPAVWVRLRDMPGNSAGLGARLRLEGSDGGRVFAEVQGSSGFMSSLPALTPVSALGLEAPLRLTVSWPDGREQELPVEVDERVQPSWQQAR
jgi:hypothetical protein